MKTLLLLAALAAPATALPEGPFVELSFEEACAQAKSSERMVFIDFYTTWCAPCKKLDKTTWKDKGVIEWLEKHTVPLKIDADKQVKLALQFNVKAYPTMIFADASGKLKGRIVGYREPAAFLAETADLMAGVRRSDRLRETLAKDSENPSLKLDLARELVRETEYEEALELLLWCWDEGEQHKPSFSGVRVSFLLSDLGRLAGNYWPAREAMVKRRDALKEVVLGQQPTSDATGDFIALSDHMKGKQLVLEVYDTLLARRAPQNPGSESEAAEEPRSWSRRHDPLPQLFELVVPQLLKARRYGEVIAGFGDPEAMFEAQLRNYKAMIGSMGEEDSLISYLGSKVVHETGQLYQALLGAGGHDASAEHLAASLVEFQPSVGTWRALMKCARIAKRKDVEGALREAAVKVLPQEDHRKLRKVKG